VCIRISNTSVNNKIFDSLQIKPREIQLGSRPSENLIEEPIKDTIIESSGKEGKVSGAGIEFVDEKQPEISLVENNSAKRIEGLVYKSLAEKAISSTSNTLIKGVSVGIPFTKKSIGFGVQHEVSKSLSKTFQMLSKENVKTASATLISSAKDAGTKSISKHLDTLLVEGKVGKGVETLTIKEASKESGGVVKAIANSYKELKSDFSVMKATQNVSSETLPKLAKSTITSTIKKEATEAAAKLSKSPYSAIGIVDDFTKNTFSNIVTKEVKKIASEKGLNISEEAIKSFVSKDSRNIMSKAYDLLRAQGVSPGSTKKLSKKAFESISKEIGQLSAKEATKTTQKIVDNAISKASSATMLGVSKEVAIGAGEKALKKGMTQGIEAGVQKAIKRAGSEVSEKFASESGKYMINQTVLYSAHMGKGTSTAIGTGIAKYGTAVGHIANGAILAYDGYDAYKKIKDPNVSMTSKALAATTVGLDVASMALDKKYKPLSWVASGLGIATSIGSDLTKDKN
jgi:hypothetical protein